MMTDEQFEKMLEKLEDRRSDNLRAVLESVLPAREDRERLIKIEGQLELSTKLMSVTRAEDLVKIENTKKTADAAHRRLDSQFIFLVSTVIITVGGMILTAIYAVFHAGPIKGW